MIKETSLWSSSVRRLDLCVLFRRRASLSFEMRVVRSRRLIFAFAVDAARAADRRVLLRKLLEDSRKAGVHAVFAACPAADAELASELAAAKFEKMSGMTLPWTPPSGIYQFPFERLPLEKAEQEPETVRAIRETIVAEYLAGPPQKGIFVNPVFEDLGTDGPRVKDYFKPAVLTAVYPVLKRMLRAGMTFADLGSGDGRLVLLASLLGAEASGVETNPALVDLARRAAAKLGRDKVIFHPQDFFETDLRGVDVIFYAGATAEPREKELEEKLQREMSPESRLLVYREVFPMKSLRKKRETGEITVYARR